MRNLTFTDVDRLGGCTEDAEVVLQMDEESFGRFYDRTARSVWLYLARIAGDSQLADDLLQETYYRFLRAGRTFDGDAHRRNYLFRIATNLVRDRQRRPRVDLISVPDGDRRHEPAAADDVAERTMRRTDLSRALSRLKPRERALVWMAYAQGASHQEIAEILGLKRASVKLLLFRARRRLAGLLTGGVVESRT
jgi:RNA polymerase sigma-70 factor (ECF subfamily)